MEPTDLVLVLGSAIAIVVLGVLIYRGAPSSKKSVAAVSVQPSEPEVLPDPKVVPAPEKIVVAHPVTSIRTNSAEILSEVSEAPSPFFDEPFVPQRKRTSSSPLPTDTTALKGLTNEATKTPGVLVISAPKRKVRAYRNALSSPTAPPRKRRASPKTLPGTSAPNSTVVAEPKSEGSDSSGVSANLSL
ncbi:MAG: hypothetical protein OK457_06620 [Thaumarchaeota archaeon]|nr:hypothetical protein [Nitrososphaerota archaeon]